MTYFVEIVGLNQVVTRELAFFLSRISKISSKSMFQKMVLKRGLTGLLLDDVFFFNFSSLIGVLLVC